MSSQPLGPTRIDVRAFLPIAVFAFVCAAATGVLVSSARPPTFEARATVTERVAARLVALTPEEELATRQRLSLHADVARSRPVLDAVIERLALDVAASSLASRIGSHVSDDGSVVIVRARDPDPDLAAALANAIADEIVGFSGRESEASPTLAGDIDAEIATRIVRFQSWLERAERLEVVEDRKRGQERRLRSLRAGIAGTVAVSSLLLPFSSASSPSGLSIVDRAVLPSEPVEPRPFLDGLLAGVLGVFVVLPFAFAPHFLARVVHGRDEVMEVAGTRTIAIVPPVHGAWLRPAHAGLEALLAPRSAPTEAYRALRWAIEPSVMGGHCRMILVAAPRRSDGCSAVAANLAVVFAQGGRRVILVDADLASPRLHVMLGTPASGGLASALANDADPEALACPGPIAGIDVLVAGEPGDHPNEHIASAQMRRLLGTLKASYDVIIIASPPLLESGAAENLGPMADAVILVVDADRTKRDDLTASATGLSGHRAWVLGAVIIHLPPRIVASVTRHLPLPSRVFAHRGPAIVQHRG